MRAKLPRVRRRERSVPVRADRCRQIEGSRHYPEPLASVDARANSGPPDPVGEEPFDGLAQPALEGLLRYPAKLLPHLGGVDRITQVVAGSILNEGDQLLAPADPV